MIVDLVSPWCAALAAADSPRARAAFRARHAPLLELLRRARAPMSESLPLATDPELLRALARRAADPALHQQLRETLARAAELGADRCRAVVLIAGDGTGETAEPIPWPNAEAVVFVEQVGDDGGMLIALARAVAALTRWGALESHTQVTHDLQHGWDRWRALGEVPLREWIYTEGLGLHLAQALQPRAAPHELLGVSRVAFSRLRERHKVFAALLAADLDQRSIGLFLRWLTPAAPAGARTVGTVRLPPGAGPYLAWRMVADRVARAGLREAIRMEA